MQPVVDKLGPTVIVLEGLKEDIWHRILTRPA